MATLNVSLGAAIAGAPIDVSTAAGVIVSLGGTFSGTVTFEAAGPNGAFNAIWARPIGGAQAATTATAAGVFVVDTAGSSYFRVRVSTYTSGLFLAQMTTTNYITKGGVQNVSLASTIAGEDITNDVQKVEQRFSYGAPAGSATTTIKSGAGFLHTVVVNTTAAAAVTIYDNTAGSGTKIATWAASTPIGATLIYDVTFSTGLTFVLAGAHDLTVSYR